MESDYIKRIVENCRRFPERVAVVDNEGERETSYGEMLSLALRTVTYLSGRGTRKGSSVTVKLPPCAEYMAVEIGIWLSRCVAVPMGDRFPQERIDYIVEHCDSALMIDEGVLAEIVSQPEAGEPMIRYPENSDGAIIVYTSGSTGKPKGILHNHSTLTDNNPRVPAAIAHDENTRFGAASPFYFVTIIGSFDVLYGGGTVHILSDSCKASAEAIGNYVEKHGITVCHISPAVLTMFRNRSKTLKAVITGGERLTTQHSQDGYALYNMFGMSETGGAVMSYEVTEMSDSSPLGRGINHNVARVVDEHGNDVPPDIEGELVLKGSFCKCYFKDSERTAALYRDGWLRTGDVARIDADGIVHYVNRKDWMLKINGQRVEPGEIESAMKCIAGITGAVVQGVDNGRGSKYLCGYYTSDGTPPETADIIKSLNKKLPRYMVPLRYVRLDRFPVNANGKIDRKNLPLPEKHRSDLQPLKGEMEHRVAEIFCRLLSVDGDIVGADSSFFELGGDSIQIMRLCAEIGKAMRKDVPPARIYENPTVREIALTLENATDDAPLDYVYSTHSDKAPLVFIHTGSTGSEAYYALANDIRDCCSFSVIEQYNIYHPDDVREGIPAIAAKYIEILKKRQPKGPYNIGGWCYGGMIAYEMACQLKESGEDMGSLILIDAYIMNSDFDRRLVIANQVEHVNREYYETSPLFEDFRERGMLETIIANSRNVGRNMAEFEPRPYTGRVHYFRAAKIADNLPVSQRTYFAHIVRELAGGIEKYVPAHQLTIYDIAEHHDGMMSEIGRKVISNRIRNIMEMERLFMEADLLYNEQKDKK
ncbi:MAG: AMP-binding protein [Bacteroidales bacterium]|nr:AMP-binding protein [Bacteroidales bacterium]